MMKNKIFNKTDRWVKRLLPFILLVFLPLSASAVTKAEADSAYAQEHYQKAVQDYEQLLKKGVSADLYYNLGNSYYRLDNITQAIIAYERALRLAPGDQDIRFNLQMARSKTIDRITPESEMFFVTWYRSLVSLMSVDGWARMALISLVAAIILALAYLFSNRIWLRKVGFFGGVLFLLIFLISNLFAWQQKMQYENRTGAIVTVPVVSVKKTPSAQAGEELVIHEGTRVDIIDKSMKQWREVRTGDGREGWIPSTMIEEI